MTTILSVKVKSEKIRKRGGGGHLEYENKIHIGDPSQVASLFGDLEIYGANIEKSFKKFKKQKEKGFPW